MADILKVDESNFAEQEQNKSRNYPFVMKLKIFLLDIFPKVHSSPLIVICCLNLMMAVSLKSVPYCICSDKALAPGWEGVFLPTYSIL